MGCKSNKRTIISNFVPPSITPIIHHTVSKPSKLRACISFFRLGYYKPLILLRVQFVSGLEVFAEVLSECEVNVASTALGVSGCC